MPSCGRQTGDEPSALSPSQLRSLAHDAPWHEHMSARTREAGVQGARVGVVAGEHLVDATAADAQVCRACVAVFAV